MLFQEKLEKRIRNSGSRLCVGLDLDPAKMPRNYGDNFDSMLAFNKKIIDATQEYALAYKPNLAFYEVFGSDGFNLLKETLEYIPADILTIADAKRGDIGNTAEKYAETFFRYFNFDSITVNPYMGEDTIRPYLEYKDKGTIVLGLTSNGGSKDFQQLRSGEQTIFEKVAQKCQNLYEEYGNVSLVVGATHNDDIKKIRIIAPDLYFLVPGIGAQGGSIASVIDNAGSKVIFNASRSIIYASNNSEDFQQNAGYMAKKYYNEIIDSLSGD